MKLDVVERLMVLEADVAELKEAAAPGLELRGHVKEVFFYSSVAAGDELLVAGKWEVVSSVDDTDPHRIAIDFESGLSRTWSWSDSVVRRAAASRIPERPNAIARSRS